MNRYRVEFIVTKTCTYELAAPNAAKAKDKAILFYQIGGPSPDLFSNMETTQFDRITAFDVSETPGKPIDKMKLAEIAEELAKRTRALEEHPKNRPKENARRNFFYQPHVNVTGRYIFVRYKASDIGGQSLTKDQAGQYLQWLRAGNIGTHREAQVE
jgi:hypothetical protein